MEVEYIYKMLKTKVTAKLKLTMVNFSRIIYILLVVGFLNPYMSFASENTISDDFQSLTGIPDDLFKVNTLHGWREVKNGVEVHYLGIDLQLHEGWKTYWRKTGNTGFPMSIIWEEKINFQDAIIHWPNPTIVTMAGEPTIGYTDRVIFPLEIHPLVPGSLIKGVGAIYLGICKDVCIPVNEMIAFDLFPTKEKFPYELEFSLKNKPETYVSAKHQDEISCQIDYQSEPSMITTQIDSSLFDLDEPFLAIYESTADPVFFFKPENINDDENRIIYSAYEILDGTDKKLDASKILLTIITENNTYEILGC